MIDDTVPLASARAQGMQEYEGYAGV
ncbi:hypothetical protein GGR13_003217 [Brevundimonas variabilis]|uniref:Uncharacterized protein n=1 Tax=Brevundimonas variabilis TaxID=74312 RepID=A0A7W9CLB3_9CAUL|nr:hypothetical protein [Brevundimonas variabilis]